MQVYTTEEGLRHKFFRVYPYIKQLRRWIKNKRREQAAARKAGTVTELDNAIMRSSADPSHDQQTKHHMQEPSIQAVLSEEAVCQQASPDQDTVPELLSVAHAGSESMPMPAPVTHCSAPEQPGQQWLNFRLDQATILQHLKFPAALQTAA